MEKKKLPRMVGKIRAINLFDWIAGGQYVSIRDLTDRRVYDGKASDLMLKDGHRNIRDELEKCELMGISAEGIAVVIRISEKKAA